MPPFGVLPYWVGGVRVPAAGDAIGAIPLEYDPLGTCDAPAPYAPRATFIQPFTDLFSEVVHVAERWQRNFRYWQQLESITFWSARLREPAGRGALARYDEARRVLADSFTSVERAAMWAAVSRHFYVVGEVSVQPVAYRSQRDAVGRCVQDARLRSDCIPEGDARRSDPAWLTALLSLDPRPVSGTFNASVLAAIFNGAQLAFTRPTPPQVTLYSGELPRADGTWYPVAIEFNDGFDVSEDGLRTVVGMMQQFNACLPGMEVERVVFERTPLVAPGWVSSYYSPTAHEIHVMARAQTALDELTHEFGHAIDMRRKTEWERLVRHADCVPPISDGELAALDPVAASVLGAEWMTSPAVPSDPQAAACVGRRLTRQLEDLFTTSVDRLDILAVIKDSYYTDRGVNNVYHGLLNRGHPEDDVGETIASLFNVMVRYPETILDNIVHPDTPPHHRVALWALWQSGQQWLGLVCPHFPVREVMLDESPGIVRLHIPEPQSTHIAIDDDVVPLTLF